MPYIIKLDVGLKNDPYFNVISTTERYNLANFRELLITQYFHGLIAKGFYLPL